MFDAFSAVSGEPRRLPAQRDDLRQLSQATGLFIQVTVLLLSFVLVALVGRSEVNTGRYRTNGIESTVPVAVPYWFGRLPVGMAFLLLSNNSAAEKLASLTFGRFFFNSPIPDPATAPTGGEGKNLFNRIIFCSHMS